MQCMSKRIFMAKRKARAVRHYWSSKGRAPKSRLSKEEFYLNKHDEEKLLLFVTGIVFGVGIVASIVQQFAFGGLALVAVAVIMLLLETHHEV